MVNAEPPVDGIVPLVTVVVKVDPVPIPKVSVALPVKAPAVRFRVF